MKRILSFALFLTMLFPAAMPAAMADSCADHPDLPECGPAPSNPSPPPLGPVSLKAQPSIRRGSHVQLNPTTVCRIANPFPNYLSRLNQDPFCCSVSGEEERLECLQQSRKEVRGLASIIEAQFISKFDRYSTLSRWGCDEGLPPPDSGFPERIQLVERTLTCELAQLKADVAKVEDRVE